MNTRAPFPLRNTVLAFLSLGAAACAPPVITDLAPPVAEPTPVSPTPALYVRGSLLPPYQLMPRSEYARYAPGGVAMSDEDYRADDVAVSAAEKLNAVAKEVAAERGLDSLDVFADSADADRAASIPFRGNPTDVKVVVDPSGVTKAYVPLGGDLMTPGNEVAAVALDPSPALRGWITVGVRPQRLAVHPAGLVFVCNQYSNFVSLIDPAADALLENGGVPVEIATEYFCTDLAFAPREPESPDADRQYLYVANRWRRSVLVYAVDVVRDEEGSIVNVVQTGAGITGLASEPLAEIAGVGSHPFRLAVDAQAESLYVASNRGGDLARVDLSTNEVERVLHLNAPTADVALAGDLVLVPTTMPDRGLLAKNEPAVPAAVSAGPVSVEGLDGRSHVAHPGALFDGTRAYNFEDVRNGLFQLDFELSDDAVYYTDDVSPEPNFSSAQKVLAGALPTTAVATASGDRVYLALGGSDLVQELPVDGSARPWAVTAQGGRTFATGKRPFGLALDETKGRLLIANWGGETLEVFDTNSGERVASVDLGYSNPPYPATNVERGEYWFVNADWSNNGRKSCASCHFDELVSDGVGFSNGAVAPTALHQVKPNHNLLSTDAYFWNGSFSDGSYRSVAFAAQIRTNCELVLFGLAEGPSSAAASRIGDPANAVTDGQDALCRPETADADGLPANFSAIRGVIASQKAVAEARVLEVTGSTTAELSRMLDVYSGAELRLPPNPLAYLRAAGELDSETAAALDEGGTLFGTAGCAGCHTPADERHPFADGMNKGRGADWLSRFIDAYAADERVISGMPSLPDALLGGAVESAATADVNVHVDPLDFLVPFCFDGQTCLSFDDPLAAADEEEETRRLKLLVSFHLVDPDRGFIPGNVRGQVAVNTPSLRGVWTQANLLHHGLARSIAETVLGPGHASLSDGETGYAVDAEGTFGGHGATTTLSDSEVAALTLYVLSIE